MKLTTLQVRVDLSTEPWTDLDPDMVTEGKIERIGLLPNGTTKGRAVVAIAVRLDDGRVIVGETTWRLFNGAAKALAASPIAQREPVD